MNSAAEQVKLSAQNVPQKPRNKLLAATVFLLLFLCLLIIGTKIAVEQSVKNQLVLVGEQLTGRKFETDSVSYHPLFFDLVITGLKMKNPPGYSKKNPAAEVDKIRIVIAPRALLSRRVHIEKLHIEGVRLYPEMKKIPVSLSDWTNMIINPEINLADIEKLGEKSSDQKESGDHSLWFLKIDEFTVTNVTVHFINIKKLKKFLPEKYQSMLPDNLSLKSYQQLNLGADGKHTGPMIAKEILNRHLDELKEWYETKKEAIMAGIKKYLPEKEKKK